MLPRVRKVIARVTPYFIRRKIPLKISKHLYFSGKFRARINGEKVVNLISTGNQIENEIYWKGFEGCHEGLSTQIWVSLIKQTKPKSIWDVGANSGTYGILAKSVFPECKVSFFEPIPKAVKMIQQNLFLNQMSADVFEIALGDYDGEGEIFFSEGTDFATSVTVNQNTTPDHSRSSRMLIQVSRADSILNEHDKQIPDLIKLDVETYEPEVLQGFGNLFPLNSIFLIEILSSSSAEKLTGFFPESRYDFFNIDDSKNSFRKTDKLEKSDFYNVLVVPKETEFDFDFLQLPQKIE
jgi:FkbM family methyltransferase